MFTLSLLLCAFILRNFLRTLEKLFEANIFTQERMTKIGIAILVGCFTLFIMKQIVFLVVIALLSISTLALVPRIITYAHRQKMKTELTGLIARLILQMRSGRSFQDAFQRIIADSEGLSRAFYERVFLIVVFPQQTGQLQDPLCEEFRRVFIQMKEQPHMATDRLMHFRDRLQMRENFRRKSGQAMRSLRAQAMVMAILYVALCGFISSHFGFYRNQIFIGVSLVLFVFGYYLLLRLGKAMKWKI